MVFKGALENGGSVRGLNAKGLGDLGRKKIDGFVDYAKTSELKVWHTFS